MISAPIIILVCLAILELAQGAWTGGTPYDYLGLCYASCPTEAPYDFNDVCFPNCPWDPDTEITYL